MSFVILKPVEEYLEQLNQHKIPGTLKIIHKTTKGKVSCWLHVIVLIKLDWLRYFFMNLMDDAHVLYETE